MLIASVRNGQIDIIASDHSPCPPEMKKSDNFFQVWGGIAGVQWTLPVLIAAGLDPLSIAALTSANGAARFGIADRGSLAEGALADLALVDFGAKRTVEERSLFHRHRITPYLGFTLPGSVRYTIRRGEPIYSEGRHTAESRGRLVRPAPESTD
jgi:allantoinase